MTIHNPDHEENAPCRKWVKTHCARFDHGGCGLKVLIEKGKGVKVFPDQSNSRSKGYVCKKGLASLERIYHPDRIIHPLRRVGEREWKQISWEEALECASANLMRLKMAFGPESVAFATGTPKGLEHFLLMRLTNIFGSPNVSGAQYVCHMPRHLMGNATCGFMPYPDYENPTQCIMLWGSNPYTTNEEGLLGIYLKRQLSNSKTKLIVIDPYMTSLAKRATLWLQIKPGTDNLLALGLLNVIINEKLYDKSFVNAWTVGFEELKEYVRAYSPDIVSNETWIPMRQIYEAARIYSTSKPALIHWGNAIENNSDHTSQTCRGLVILMAISGNLDAPGGNVENSEPPLMPLRKLVSFDKCNIKNRSALRRYYGISVSMPTIPTPMLIRTILNEKPYAIKALFIQGSNPLVSCPGSKNVLRALRKLEFVMVSDLFMTPTAAMANLFLPAATNMEFNDIGNYGSPHGYVLARPKLVEPQGECWSDIKIINELGKSLGLGEYFWSNSDQCLQEILAPSGMTYQVFSEKGIVKGETAYYKYRERGFRTPSGKVEIQSSILEREGYSSFPTTDIPRSFDEKYPLLLTSTKPKYFFHTGFRNIKSLRNRHPKPRIKVNPKTGVMYNIRNGDVVRVMTEHGETKFEAVFSEYLHPSVVIADYGWWFPEKDITQMFGWDQSNINILTNGDSLFDPIVGSVPLRGIPCRIDSIHDDGRSP